MVSPEGFQGYIWKWTNYLGGWQQRWFLLKDGTLTYYKDENTTDTGCRGSFKLDACNIIVHPVDVLRFDLVTSTQRLYLRTNTKPCRQRWIIQLGTTKANISEEMPEVATVTLSSFNEHKSELRTVRLMLSEQVDKMYDVCNAKEVDSERLKECQAMVNELCEELMRTLDACTTNLIDGDDRDCSTPLVRRCHVTSESGPLSLGSYIPPPQDPLTPDALTAPDTPTEWGELAPAGTKRPDKLPCTYFTSIADRFEDLACRCDAIPTTAFLDACSAVPKLLLAIGGKPLITLSLDMSNNILKMQTKLKLHPSKSDTLQAMVHLEIGTQTTHAKHSATVALLWLYRELVFVREFLLVVVKAAGVSNMAGSFVGCYERTLRPHHNMMSRSIYSVAAKAIPYREDMLRALGHDGMLNTDTAVLKDMTTYSNAIATVTKYIETFYINNKLLAL